MSAPYRVDPESTKLSVHQDPFLEFASERPSSLDDQEGAQTVSEVPYIETAPDRAPSRRHASAISPSVAFAIGVAGLATAAVGYYQMGQVLADRSASAAQAAAVSLPPAAPVVPPPPTVGRLEIASDPAGATVKVDGEALGVTPLTLPDFKPGRHAIVMTRGTATVTRTVELTAGGTATVTAVLQSSLTDATREVPVAASSAPFAPAKAGWVTFESPIELRILDRGRLRGSTLGRLTLAEGAYELELVSDIYEIRQSVSAKIDAGRSTRVVVPLPSGSLSINALPWADVWVDGSPVGTTPLANLTFTVGNHEVLFRHPTLGERQETVVVRAVTPARLGVNLNK